MKGSEDCISTGNSCNSQSLLLEKENEEETIDCEKVRSSGKILEMDLERMRTASFMTGVFNYANTMMGVGILSLPYAYYSTGLFSGFLFQLFSFGINFISTYALSYASFSLGGVRSYEELIYQSIGPFWGRLCTFLIPLHYSGTSIIYLTTLGRFIKSVTDSYFPSRDIFLFNERVIIVVFSCFVMFPLSLFRATKKMGFTSLLAVASIVGVFLFITINAIVSLSGARGSEISVHSDYLFFQTGIRFGFYPLFFLGLPMITYTTQALVQYVPILYEIKNGSVKKSSKIVISTSIIVMILYFSTAILGLLTFGDDIKDNVLTNFSGDNIPANICRLLFGVNILFGFPVIFFTVRSAVANFIFCRKEYLPTFHHVSLTLAIFLAILLAALFVPGLGTLVSFFGAIGGASFLLFFPGVILWKIVAEAPHVNVIWKSKNGNGGRRWGRIGVRVVAVAFLGLYVLIIGTGVMASALNAVEDY